MYGIFTYIYHKNQPNVGKYTIHGWYGIFFKRFKLLAISTRVENGSWELHAPPRDFRKGRKALLCPPEKLKRMFDGNRHASKQWVSSWHIYLSIYLSFVLFRSILFYSILFHSIVYTSLPEIVHWQFRQILKNSIGRPFQTLPTLP